MSTEEYEVGKNAVFALHALLITTVTESIQQAKVVTTGRSRRKEWVRYDAFSISPTLLKPVQSYFVKVRAFVPLSHRAYSDRFLSVEELWYG